MRGRGRARVAPAAVEEEQALKAAGEAAAEAYAACPNLSVLVGALLEGGIDLVRARCTVTPGIALKPMLAKVGCGSPSS